MRTPRGRPPRSWLRPIAIGLVGALVVFGLHKLVRRSTRIDPPDIAVGPLGAVKTSPRARTLGRSFSRTHGGIHLVGLKGDAKTIGATHATLLRKELIRTENVMFSRFESFVPSRIARSLVMDIGLWRYRNVHHGYPAARIEEIAAQAKAFSPDPFEAFLPTFHRMVLLHSVYDMALSFEHSPLVGCSTFAFKAPYTRDDHALLARAFDFEIDPAFDEHKTVFLVDEHGQTPFLSVSWPGLVGVVSGMNAHGLALVVHGARAGPVEAVGWPVVLSLRHVLGRAKTVVDAARLFAKQEIMVSHIVIALDASGDMAAIERVPGKPPHVRRPEGDTSRFAVTNHLEGPMAHDAKNERVIRETTSIARRQRLETMLRAQTKPGARIDAKTAVAMLRDKRCEGDPECLPGDRRAIDANIATHAIVADATARRLWVSRGPHLGGAFTAFDIEPLLRELREGKAAPRPLVIDAESPAAPERASSNTGQP